MENLQNKINITNKNKNKLEFNYFFKFSSKNCSIFAVFIGFIKINNYKFS